jgi:hypothetical protein
MLDSKKDIADDAAYERLVDRMSTTDASERERILQVLKMARELFIEHFADRIEAVVVDYRSYSRTERRLPLLVYTPWESPQRYIALRKELGDKVLAPVRERTRLSIPVELLRLDQDPAPTRGIDLLYRRAD